MRPTTTKQAINTALMVIGEDGYSGHEVQARSRMCALSTIIKSHVPEEAVAPIYRELHRQELVDIQKKEVGYYCVSLTPSGAQRLLKHTIDQLQINTNVAWDGHWRLVCFDIPKGKDKERLYFNRRLHELGFTMVQRSMWVHPFECLKEIVQITDFVNLTRYVTVLEVVNLDSRTTKRLQAIYGSLLSLHACSE